MPLIDDVKESHGKVKGKGFKYTISYIYEYYKWHILGTIAVIAILFSLIKSFVTYKDPIFTAMFVNAFQGIETEEFAVRNDIDTKEYAVIVDATNMLYFGNEAKSQENYVTIQKIVAMVAAKDIDVMVAPEEVISYYKNTEMYADLRDYFPEDYLTSLGDKVIWYDLEIEEADETITKKTLPIAIDVTDAAKLTVKDSECFYTDMPVLYTIIANTEHPDYAMDFYKYIIE